MLEEAYHEKKDVLDEKHAQELHDLQEQKALALTSDNLASIKTIAKDCKRKRDNSLLFGDTYEPLKLLMSGDEEEVCDR
jgi:hypothetical protein